MSGNLIFLDTEVGVEDKKIYDIGAVGESGAMFRGTARQEFCCFIGNADYLCGHNIVHHDIVHLMTNGYITGNKKLIDTLYLSPLLFPERPYHRLLKDDKLLSDELNNPINDCKKAKDLFYDEINAFAELTPAKKQIYYALLNQCEEFSGFFSYIEYEPVAVNLIQLIEAEFYGRICENASLEPVIRHYPRELAYTLSLLSCDDRYSITPPWLIRNFPKIENVIQYLRNTACEQKCRYCSEMLDIHKALKNVFGYDRFRTYDGEPLQENAAQAAVDGKSVLAVFPTGGGKSITFQLPALMAGKAMHGLTVVISPLQSLMKDQVDNLNESGINEAVTINGLLDPIERMNAIERVANGAASLLYISPEQLRSRTIEKLLMGRNIARFVIDEAHCFSAWGQDFRVDYLYIGDFLKELQKKKGYKKPIPVSCFTATAKQKVITDICDYFKRKLDIEPVLFASSATRENLHYTVLYKETDEEKYITLRNLISQKECPTIVYVSRTKRTVELAEKLTNDGFPARAFNGKMDANDKILNQEAFIRNDAQIMVATSAFGMGVDKKDVKLVIHYDISASLEDYVQEAGRAGRDPSMQAECYVLFNDKDLDKHFVLLNQTKLSISEIQQVWRAIKELTKKRASVCCSALEIARQAGWDDSVSDIETRVRTAVSALENAGYVKRGRNVPRVYASSILADNMAQASYRIDSSVLFSDEQRLNAKRIIKSLITSRSIARAGNDEAESRVDYLADVLGLHKSEVINIINLMRQDGLLSDMMDMSAHIFSNDTENKSKTVLDRFVKLERFILSQLTDDVCDLNLKELNEAAQDEKLLFSNVKNIRTILIFYAIKSLIKKEEYKGTQNVRVRPELETAKLKAMAQLRHSICLFIVEFLFARARNESHNENEEKPVLFSVVELLNGYNEAHAMEIKAGKEVTIAEIEDALLYLSKIGAMKLEGGFLVLYNGMELKRLVSGGRIRYKQDDYRFLDEFYKQKIQQIHIVGEYANLMVRDYDAALQFVQDYFNMDYKKFIASYFKGERALEIMRNITPELYKRLFDELSEKQLDVINDKESKFIVVAAGPGSGKTKLLVHKLASLVLLEDVKHEQLLMITFSRAAATEFKTRIRELIGNAANFVEIKTFHSYCFDLLGKIGSLDKVGDVIRNATELIKNGEVEQGRITKSVIVIDEAQDMDENDFELIKVLIASNDDIRVIAVGDDDQNIYQFRGSDSKYMRSLVEEYGAAKYEMTDNYRSKSAVVAFANAVADTIGDRMKSEPISAVNEDDKGCVLITHHKSENMEEAVVNKVIATKESGKCCVLTQTNDEALQILGLFTQKGIRAKLIQSLDGFKLRNLAEIRYFLKLIDKNLYSPIISNELWAKAQQGLFSNYADSTCLEICNNLIRTFELTQFRKYRTDLEQFINESNYEDFYNDESDCVYISTIHKSKGREFDNVYMLLKNATANDDEQKRKLYVGTTRAKNALYIHTNNSLFGNIRTEGTMHEYDETIYNEPSEISLQLSYRDVLLDYFKGKKDIIFRLHSGTEMHFAEGGCLTAVVDGKCFKAVILSRACRERIAALEEKGYKPDKAYVSFVVAWKGENDDEETPVILPLIKLVKNNQQF